MPFESNITHRIMSYLNGLDKTIAEKVKGEAECSGRADINGCYHGLTLRIEVKTPDNRNKPSRKQLYNLYQWNRAGALCIVAYSLEVVVYALGKNDHQFLYKRWEICDEENKCKSLILFPYCGAKYEDLYKVYYDGVQVSD